MRLRQYQTEAVNAAIGYLQSNAGAPLVVSATGTGKSVMIAELIRRLKFATPHIRVLLCTHVKELADQNAKKLKVIYPDADIGIYCDGLNLKQYTNDIVFSTVQSIYRLPAADLDGFNLLIVDESHSISRKSQSMWATLIGKLGKHRMVGFTATDFRLDSGSLTTGDDAMFKDVCFEYGLGRAIQDGYLCRLVGKETKTKYDISGVGKVGGEYNLKQLQEATNIDSMTQRAVAEIVEKGELRSTWLVFCNGIEHSFAVRDEIRRHGITCETVTGDTHEDERDRILQSLKDGKLQAVTNFGVLTTGIDIPNIDLIAMLRHTMSAGLLLQMAGRGTRTVIDLTPYATASERRQAIASSAKPDCLFLDFAGNIMRHGLLDLIKAKDKKKRGEGEHIAPVKACPDCASLIAAQAKKCPDCGYQWPENTVTKLEALHRGNIISQAEVRKVRFVEYLPHNLNKEGKTPCLMVKYHHDDGFSTREYVCLLHTGFAQQKAIKWWQERGGGSFTGLGLPLILEDAQTLRQPYAITVVKEGKYDRIKAYDFNPPSAEAEHFEISF